MKSRAEIRVIAVPGMPEVRAGDDLASLIVAALRGASLEVFDGDVFVVAQKVVSKSEGRLARLDLIEPSPLARQWAALYEKDARVVEVVLRESSRIVRMDRGVLICQTRHGFICANAGVDASNVPEGFVALLPEDADASAQRLRSLLERALGAQLAVIISDTFGRPWRQGLVNVALGVAGLAPIIDYRGRTDWCGRQLRVTEIAVADELASAAELVMGKTEGVPVAIIRGFKYDQAEGTGRDLIRPPEQDLFR
jgi:coenzyme F420-0:L-glutamate ligase/coenzyme F420-1:gamma-L-glutamate ligase